MNQNKEEPSNEYDGDESSYQNTPIQRKQLNGELFLTDFGREDKQSILYRQLKEFCLQKYEKKLRLRGFQDVLSLAVQPINSQEIVLYEMRLDPGDKQKFKDLFEHLIYEYEHSPWISPQNKYQKKHVPRKENTIPRRNQSRQQLPKLTHYSLTFYFKDALEQTILKELKSNCKLYNGVLEDISKQIHAIKILISDVDIQNSTICLQVVYDTSSFNVVIAERTIKQEFINQLCIFESKFDYFEFLRYLQIRQDELEDQFQIIVRLEKQSKVIIIGMAQSINEIKQYVKEMEEKKQNYLSNYTFQVPNQLIFNKLLQLHQNKLLNLQEKAEIQFTFDNQIILTQGKQKMQADISTISKMISDLENQLITTVCEFNEKEVNYIQKKLQSTISKLQHQFVIDFSSNSQTQFQFKKTIASQIIHSNKELSIVFADISKIECDAIVNSCNDKMSFGDLNVVSGVNQSIFEMAGKQYAQFCQDYIYKSSELQIGEVFTYKMPKGKQINYIFNVATPIYSTGEQTKRDLSDIKKNIKAIFQEADKLYLDSLAIPILGAGVCGFSFQEVGLTVINEVINELFSNKYSLKTVYITEVFEQRVVRLNEIMKRLVEPPKEIRKIKYQWQWIDGNSYKDYDDEDINRQIDEAFEEFQNQQQKITFTLRFPYSKKPGTHTVDLQKAIMRDDSVFTIYKITEKQNGNTNRFHIDNQQIDDQLNEYLALQRINKQNQFQIFYKRYQIIFTEQEYYQINEVTKFKRQIQNIPYTKENFQTQIRNILQQQYIQIKTFKFENCQLQKSNTSFMAIQSFSEEINQEVTKCLETELKKVIINFRLTVPNLQGEDLEGFEKYIKSLSNKITGQFQSGNQITLEIFKSKEPKIEQYLAQIKKTIKQYPLDWQPQNQNCVKILLNESSSEYKKIFDLFKQTDNGYIKAIFRIQNKYLWDNYISEKQKIMDIHRESGLLLNQIEQERYLWHGVRGSNPNVIYSGIKEAFDQTYSQGGMWGSGIYFAENASYSRGYSYRLTKQDDAKYQGMNVFLCCLVTTGKCEQRDPDSNIKRPNQGFDCIQGETGGSNVYILYSMDIRRAYPAYEIIFK